MVNLVLIVWAVPSAYILILSRKSQLSDRKVETKLPTTLQAGT